MEKINEIENKITTIRDILEGKNTIQQLDILSRADRLFPNVGRYYGGPLTEEQISILDPKDKNQTKINNN